MNTPSPESTFSALHFEAEEFQSLLIDFGKKLEKLDGHFDIDYSELGLPPQVIAARASLITDIHTLQTVLRNAIIRCYGAAMMCAHFQPELCPRTTRTQ